MLSRFLFINGERHSNVIKFGVKSKKLLTKSVCIIIIIYGILKNLLG